MQILKEIIGEGLEFIRAINGYLNKRLHQAGFGFEKKKDVLVTVLVAKRGQYQRPFLHMSLVILVVAGIIVLPLINPLNESSAQQLTDFTPPSAVLSSFDEQDTVTQISDKPRDTVISYVVQEGDTLSQIAEKFGVSSDSLKWANSTKTLGDSLTIGEEIAIPPVSGVVHRVSRGDTIYSIAKKYDVDPQVILNWPFNTYEDLDTFALNVGQTLVVPGGFIATKEKPTYSPRALAQVPITEGSGRFMWPSQGMITQYPVSYHMAIDIANRSLPPVAASDGGTVSVVKRDRYGYGHHIIINHANGYQTLYAHLSEIYVSSGQSVSKGSVIGKVGSTGRSTGPHLHFEVRKDGRLLNPQSFL